MISTNGTGALEKALPSVTEVTLENGLRVWAHHISQRDYAALLVEWRDANPPPDKKDYELPVPEGEASFAGQTLSAEGNPAYQALLKQRDADLRDHFARAYLLGFVEFPDYSDDELIAIHARRIARKRKAMTIPDDAWEATLFYALIETRKDYQLLVSAVENNLPVGEEEVIDAMRIFRYLDQRQPNRGLSDGETETPGAEAEAGAESNHVKSGV